VLAQNVSRLHDLQWNAETSMLKTLGAKHRSTVTKMAARHRAKIETSDGPRTCFEARKYREGRKDLIARFGGIVLRQNRRAVITDPVPAPALYPRKELISRLRKRECELCETGTTVAVHRKYSEVLWKGMPVADVAVARGHDGDSVTGEGFRRSAVAGPRCGGPRGWRSRAGTG